MPFDEAEFEAGLEAYQARLYEEAAEAAERSHDVAARPSAVPMTVAVGELRPGDFMTNEGPSGRWVKVVKLAGPSCNVKRRERNRKPADGELSILFEIPESVVVSGETRYWIERPAAEQVMVDSAAREGTPA